MSGEIIYSPETMTYTLSNGTDRITLPNWAHRVIKDEVEREIRPLNNKIEILSDALALVRDENAKLRKQGERLFDKTLELGTDNAKLRELVKDIYVDMWASGEWLEHYEQRMRELRIEVDE